MCACGGFVSTTADQEVLDKSKEYTRTYYKLISVQRCCAYWFNVLVMLSILHPTFVYHAPPTLLHTLHHFLFLLPVEHAISDINKCVGGADGTDPEATLAALTNEFAQLSSVDESCGARYHVALHQAREEKGEDLSQEEIRGVIERVNEEVRLERLGEEGGREEKGERERGKGKREGEREGGKGAREGGKEGEGEREEREREREGRREGEREERERERHAQN